MSLLSLLSSLSLNARHTCETSTNMAVVHTSLVYQAHQILFASLPYGKLMPRPNVQCSELKWMYVVPWCIDRCWMHNWHWSAPNMFKSRLASRTRIQITPSVKVRLPIVLEVYTDRMRYLYKVYNAVSILSFLVAYNWFAAPEMHPTAIHTRYFNSSPRIILTTPPKWLRCIAWLKQICTTLSSRCIA